MKTKHIKAAGAAVALLIASGPALAGTLLMNWYEHENYQGYNTPISGDYGTCDSEGYTFSVRGYWRRNLSSAIGFGGCNIARFTTPDGYNETFWLPVHNLGPRLNDNVGLIRVWRR